jgi:putative membrane protein (TIGR04086 family)
MLGVLRISAVMIGAAGGALVSSAVFLVGLLAARLAGAEAGPAIVLSLSLLAGLAAGGYLSGRVAPYNGRFHGSMTGLVMAAIVLIISVLGGSPAPTGQVALLAAMAIVVGGISGWLGGRRRYNGRSEPTG